MVSLVFALLLLGYATCIPLVEEDDFDESAMLNPDLFEGDILGIDPEADRNAMTTLSKRWPNATLPYKIMPELATRTSLIRDAMKHIEDRTCIRFRPATPSDVYYLQIFAGQGCYTYVGRALRPQPLSLGRGCYLLSIVVHELMHAVGFYHEHSRSDRDSYINIHYENITPRAVPQFRKLLPNQNTLYDKFDFNSVMLYGETAFSKDLQAGLKTMTSKIPGTPIPNPYTKSGLSQSDIYRAKKLYECKN